MTVGNLQEKSLPLYERLALAESEAYALLLAPDFPTTVKTSATSPWSY